MASMAFTQLQRSLAGGRRHRAPRSRTRPYGPARIGARGQNNGNAGPEHDPRRVGLRQINKVFRQHVAGLKIGHDQDLCRPATADLMPLILAASLSTALSKASGPSSKPPVIWPRSAILQSAAASMVEGILAVTVSTAERIATRGVPRPTA